MVDDAFLTLPADPQEAREVFNRLPMEHQLEIILRQRGPERVRSIFLSDHPKELMQRLPELEVFLTVKELGRKDAVDLLSLTTSDQLQYLLDLDVWKKGRLDPDRVARWLEILLECGEDRVRQFLESTDPEELAPLLSKSIHVIKVEGEPTEVMD